MGTRINEHEANFQLGQKEKFTEVELTLSKEDILRYLYVASISQRLSKQAEHVSHRDPKIFSIQIEEGDSPAQPTLESNPPKSQVVSFRYPPANRNCPHNGTCTGKIDSLHPTVKMERLLKKLDTRSSETLGINFNRALPLDRIRTTPFLLI